MDILALLRTDHSMNYRGNHYLTTIKTSVFAPGLSDNS